MPKKPPIQTDPVGGYVDLTQMIRSIQRIEGKKDCFAGTPPDCPGPNCQWQALCLKEIENMEIRRQKK